MQGGVAFRAVHENCDSAGNVADFQFPTVENAPARDAELLRAAFALPDRARLEAVMIDTPTLWADSVSSGYAVPWIRSLPITALDWKFSKCFFQLSAVPNFAPINPARFGMGMAG